MSCPQYMVWHPIQDNVVHMLLFFNGSWLQFPALIRILQPRVSLPQLHLLLYATYTYGTHLLPLSLSPDQRLPIHRIPSVVVAAVVLFMSSLLNCTIHYPTEPNR